MRCGLLVLVAWVAACARTETFVCEGDDECVDGVRSGACEASGFCSFPDSKCPSKKRYGDYASEDLAGECTPPPSDACVEPCGACEQCEAGACVPVVGGACELACEAYVFKQVNEGDERTCVAYAAGVGAGVCDEAGACVLDPGSCSGPGAAFVPCDGACADPDHNCKAGAPITEVTPATHCLTDVESNDCRSACVNVMNEPSLLSPRQCDATGRCVDGTPTTCGAYTCMGDDCRTSCTKQAECAPGSMCADNLCQ